MGKTRHRWKYLSRGHVDGKIALSYVCIGCGHPVSFGQDGTNHYDIVRSFAGALARHLSKLPPEWRNADLPHLLADDCQEAQNFLIVLSVLES